MVISTSEHAESFAAFMLRVATERFAETLSRISNLEIVRLQTFDFKMLRFCDFQFSHFSDLDFLDFRVLILIERDRSITNDTSHNILYSRPISFLLMIVPPCA